MMSVLFIQSNINAGPWSWLQYKYTQWRIERHLTELEKLLKNNDPKFEEQFIKDAYELLAPVTLTDAQGKRYQWLANEWNNWNRGETSADADRYLRIIKFLLEHAQRLNELKRIDMQVDINKYFSQLERMKSMGILNYQQKATFKLYAQRWQQLMPAFSYIEFKQRFRPIKIDRMLTELEKLKQENSDLFKERFVKYTHWGLEPVNTLSQEQQNRYTALTEYSEEKDAPLWGPNAEQYWKSLSKNEKRLIIDSNLRILKFLIHETQKKLAAFKKNKTSPKLLNVQNNVRETGQYFMLLFPLKEHGYLTSEQIKELDTLRNQWEKMDVMQYMPGRRSV